MSVKVYIDPELDIPTRPTELYGDLFAPEDFSQLVELLGAPWGKALGWRGQAQIEWRVDSTAVRRLQSNAAMRREVKGLVSRDMEDFDSLPLEDQVSSYEKRLLSDARLKGFGYKDGRELSDLELLASLQHFGAATRLIDFTGNAFIALWFACQGSLLEDGLLLGFRRRGPNITHLREPLEIEKPIGRILEGHPNSILYWQPLYLYERMRAQQSIFVFGMAHDGGPWSSLTSGPFEEDASHNFIAFVVSDGLKDSMLTMWDRIFGYDEVTLFPDIEGFSEYHSSGSYLGRDFFD